MRWWRFSVLASIGGSLLAAAPPGELRDIAGPVPMPDDPVWHWYAGAVACAAAAGAGAYWIRRRRPAVAPAAEEPDPPYEEALKALHALAGAPPPAEEFYTRLTGIVRRYAARRFGADAPDATSGELLAALEGRIAEEHGRLLRAFFAEADLVKFAAAAVQPDAPERALEACRSFVRETAWEAGRAV